MKDWNVLVMTVVTCAGLITLAIVLYYLLKWLQPAVRVHVDPQGFPLQEHPQGDGANGNVAGQQVNHPQQQGAQGGNGDGAVQGVQEIHQVNPQQGGGGDQQEDHGGHHQQLSPLFPGNDGNHQASRTAKVNPIQDGTLPSVNELKETTPALQEYALSGKLNAKSLLKILARKPPCEEQNASSEPLLNAAG